MTRAERHWCNSMSNHQPTKEHIPEISKDVEALATVAFIGIVCGLLLPRVADQSFDRGEFLWLVTCVAVGVVQSSRKPLDHVFVLKGALVATIAFWGSTLVITAIVHISNDINSSGEIIQLHPLPGQSTRLSDSLAPIRIGTVISLIAFSTFIMTAVTAYSSRQLVQASVALFSFGDAGINRVNSILRALAALVSIAFALWSAFG